MGEASLHIDKEALKFSAAHFTIFSATEAERLHGHNYHVMIDIWGDVTGEGLIIDAGEVKRIVGAICSELDERVLIPTESPHLLLRHLADNHFEMRYGPRQYVLPNGDCAFLPLTNITIETLSSHLANRLREALGANPNGASIRRIRVGVEESPGQMGACEITL